MKKVIFFCLLSLSVCLSKPSEPQVAPTNPLDTHEVALAASTNSTPSVPAKQGETVPPHPAENAAKNANTVPGAATEKVTETVPTKPANETAKETDDKKNNASLSPAAVTVAPVTTNNATSKPVPVTLAPEKNDTTPADHGKSSNSTTPKPAVPKTTEAPKEGDKIVQARGFDGASFIGGIILTLGLLAIGFMGFKYYKNQTERNYHTL